MTAERATDLRQQIAALLMTTVAPGERLPTVRVLAERFGASIGTVQGVLARLERDGAIDLAHRGRHGAYLDRRSLERLWAAAESEPLILSLPLPTTPRINGLATAVRALLSEAGVPAYVSFIRGSRRRMEGLRHDRCRVAVMSALAAGERSAAETIAQELPPQSYVVEHRVYLRPDASTLQRPLRVVFDRDSADFQRITELEFAGQGAEFVPATYMQFARLLDEGQVDGAVWDADEARAAHLPALVVERPLSAAVRENLSDRNSRATFLVRSDDPVAHHVVTSILRPAALLAIQQEVIAGTRVPEY